MPRFSANLTFLFTELPFLDRFAAAADCGFTAVEYVCLYDHAPDVLADAARRAGVATVLLNIPHGDWAGGERGIAILPDRVAEFRASLAATVRTCEATGCRMVNCLAGLTPAGVDPAVLRATLVANLRHAAAVLGEAGIRVTVEPINTIDLPGFFLATSRDTLAVLDDVATGSGAADIGRGGDVALQYDCYHMQRMEGRLVATLEAHIGRIGHVQIADVPGRHEPGTGTIDYRTVFATLDRLGYGGHVGLEYRPRTTTRDSFGWMKGER
jgi:hydroxypyruvate isomerase